MPYRTVEADLVARAIRGLAPGLQTLLSASSQGAAPPSVSLPTTLVWRLEPRTQKSPSNRLRPARTGPDGLIARSDALTHLVAAIEAAAHEMTRPGLLEVRELRLLGPLCITSLTCVGWIGFEADIALRSVDPALLRMHLPRLARKAGLDTAKPGTNLALRVLEYEVTHFCSAVLPPEDLCRSTRCRLVRAAPANAPIRIAYRAGGSDRPPIHGVDWSQPASSAEENGAEPANLGDCPIRLLPSPEALRPRPFRANCAAPGLLSMDPRVTNGCDGLPRD